VTVATLLAALAGALAAAGGGLLLASLPFLRRRGRMPRAGGRGEGLEAAWTAPGGPSLLRLLARLGVGLRPVPSRPPRDLAARIDAAGRPGGFGPHELMAAKTAAAVAAAIASVALSTTAPGRLGVALVTLGPVAGFLAPDLWLARRAAVRARRVRRELPGLLDLLRVSVEAGRSLGEALREVGARTDGPLAGEWRALGRQVALGIPLKAALAGMAERLPLPEVSSLVAALDRARRHGAPLAETLAAQSRDARFALSRHAREEAARAGPKIQLVVALLLVPSVLLLVAAALAAALLGDGEGGGSAVPL
jgi:tight adherence protein C